MASSGVVFGTSGLRGLVAQMTDEVCFAYVSAFLQKVVAQHGAIGKVILGHDLRPSSPTIARACAAAVQNAGGEVIYAGALPTPALALAGLTLQAPVIVVTGSHIPFDRNGIKFYRHDGEISKQDEHAIQHSQVEIPENFTIASLPPINHSISSLYIKRYVDFFGVDSLKGMRVASYEHSSVARDLLAEVLSELGAEVIRLERTETFVPIDTEAVSAGDIEKAKVWAGQYKFDAIFSTDGDADRPLIADENGQWLRGDIVGILCAKFLNIDNVVTPVSSNTALEKSAWFTHVTRTKIGSPFVIAGMEEVARQNQGKVAGFEANGGFLLGSGITRNGKFLAALPTRDALLPMLALLSFCRSSNLKLSELLASLPHRYTCSNRIQNISQAQSKQLLDTLQQDWQMAARVLAPNAGVITAVDLTDGLRATFSNQDIVHLRASGNAPELRCYAESESESRALSLCESCLHNIKQLHILSL